WCISPTLTGRSKMSAGSSRSLTSFPYLSTTGSFIAMRLPLLLHCRADHHQATLGAGDAALHSQQIPLRVNHDDLKVLRGYPVAAHATRHARALQNTAGGAGRADGAGRALTVRLAVSLRAAPEAMPLHCAGKTLALARPHDVDAIALLEHLDRDLLTGLDVIGVVDPELAQMAQRREGSLQCLTLRMLVVRLEQTQVAALRLLEAALDLALTRILVVDTRADFLEADLHSVVTICVLDLDLGHPAGAGLDHRYRDRREIGRASCRVSV